MLVAKRAKMQKYRKLIRKRTWMRALAAPLGRYIGYAELARRAITVQPMPEVLTTWEPRLISS